MGMMPGGRLKGNALRQRTKQNALKTLCGFMSFGRLHIRRLGVGEMLELKHAIVKLQDGIPLDEQRHGKRVKL